MAIYVNGILFQDDSLGGLLNEFKSAIKKGWSSRANDLIVPIVKAATSCIFPSEQDLGDDKVLQDYEYEVPEDDRRPLMGFVFECFYNFGDNPSVRELRGELIRALPYVDFNK